MLSTIGLNKTTDAPFTKKMPADSSAGFLLRKWLQVRPTALTASRWPDLVVAVGIFVINLGAAREVYLAARAEHRAERTARDGGETAKPLR